MKWISNVLVLATFFQKIFSQYYYNYQNGQFERYYPDERKKTNNKNNWQYSGNEILPSNDGYNGHNKYPGEGVYSGDGYSGEYPGERGSNVEGGDPGVYPGGGHPGDESYPEGYPGGYFQNTIFPNQNTISVPSYTKKNKPHIFTLPEKLFTRLFPWLATKAKSDKIITDKSSNPTKPKDEKTTEEYKKKETTTTEVTSKKATTKETTTKEATTTEVTSKKATTKETATNETTTKKATTKETRTKNATTKKIRRMQATSKESISKEAIQKLSDSTTSYETVGKLKENKLIHFISKNKCKREKCVHKNQEDKKFGRYYYNYLFPRPTLFNYMQLKKSSVKPHYRRNEIDPRNNIVPIPDKLALRFMSQL